jgi:chaperonin GroES
VWDLLPAGRLRPAADRIVVRPDPRQHRLASGLWLPDTADDEVRPQTGTVQAAGPGRRSQRTGARIPMDVRVGDRVLYRQWGGRETTVGSEEVLILWPRDVFAVISDDGVGAV